MRKVSGFLPPLVAMLVFGNGCAVHQTEAPALTGPSELALALRITATPDSINQDGASQAAVGLLALGPNGQPVVGLTVRLDMQVGGVLQDFGTLSARTVVTGNDGRASAIYTAPPPPPASLGGSGTRVSIFATPTGNNFQASQSQSTDIRLVPPGVILPPAETPTPKFTMSPTPPQTGLPTLFDASTSCAGASACTSTSGIVDFTWNFGDGTGAVSGRTVSHTFTSAGAFNVTLTVTNDRGVSASTSQTVTVGASASPIVDFSFSPSNPGLGQDITFVANARSGVAGHSIVRYDWNFGSGNPASGQVVTKSYDTAGNYTVTLTVTDDIGNQATATKSVTVGAVPGGLFATFTFSPTAPTVGAQVFFNASSSTGSIVRYDWDFGDGVTASGAGPTQTHVFTAVGQYVVRLTVFDAAGHSNAATQTVSVTAQVPNAVLSITKTGGLNIQADGSASSPSPGASSIVSYTFVWGDGQPNTSGSASTAAHTYAAVGTYTVRLTVTDNLGRTNSTTQTVTFP